MQYLWKIGGEAGFGIMTTGLVFSKIASRLGYYIYDYVQYPSLVRGGHNAFELLISDSPVTSLKQDIDCLVCLNKETFDLHRQRLKKESLVIYDPDEFKVEGDFIKITVPLTNIINQLKGPVVMKNTVALGASMAVLGAPFDELLQIIEEQFGKKGEEVVKFNKKFAEEGFNFVQKNHHQYIKKILIKKPAESRLVLTGNDAFSLGAVAADARFYSAYPMTPSSSVLTTLAAWQNKTGMVVRHAEDEISVINTAIGSSFAGVRSALGTSGGGFALMVESVSLAGITETPLVIFLAQRPGPATGMPTWTEQGDLLFTIFSGHGEFPKIVLAPGDVQEMVELTMTAFNLADLYQTPVIILSDMLLSESHQSLSKVWLESFIKGYKVERGKIFNNRSGFKDESSDSSFKEKSFLRYQITDDGISPRLIPGTPGYFYQANSYEHLEDGHTTEDDRERKKQVEKRNKKMETFLRSSFQPPRVYGDLETSEIIFVGWGSTKGSLLAAQKILQRQNKKAALIHFNYLFPLDEEKIKPLLEKKGRYLLVENNSHGQFGQLLRQITGVEIKEKILKYDGRPFWPEEIVKKILN